MTLMLFLALLMLFSTASSILTEGVKMFLDEAKAKYSSNVVVLIVAIIVGLAGTALAYLFLGIPFTVENILCIPLMAIAVWVGAMIGYDKVMQMIEQLDNIKLN